MSPRLLLACGIALVALGSALAALTALSDAQGDPAPERLAGPRMPEGLRAFDFTLPDQRGVPVSMAATRGDVVVLSFVYSRCTSTCPVTLQTIRGALDDLRDAGRSVADVEVLALSVDPEADTPRRVRRFLARQHVADFVRYLVGTRAQMRPIWKRYGIAPQGKGAEDHTAFVLLADRRGLLRVGFPSQQMTPEELAHDIGVLLDERRRL